MKKFAYWMLLFLLHLPGAAVAEDLYWLEYSQSSLPNSAEQEGVREVFDWNSNLNLGLQDEVIWLRFTTSEDLSDQELYINNPLLHQVTLFQLSPETTFAAIWQPVNPVLEVSFLGEKRPAARPRFSLEADSRYLLRLETSQAVRLGIFMQTREATARDQQLFYLLQGAYFGLVLGLAIYNLLLYQRLKDPSYLWYVGFACSVALYFFFQKGLSFNFLPFLSLAANESLMFTATGLSNLLTLEFVRRFLRLDHQDPWLVPSFHWMQRVLLVLLPLAWLPWPGLMVLVYSLVSPVVILLVVVASWRAWKLRAFRPARWLLLAWSFLILGVTLFILAAQGILPHHFLTYYGFQLGAVSEILLFSLALADRIQVLQQEKEELAGDRLVLQQLSDRDSLTGLFNRRHLDSYLDKALSCLREEKLPLVVALVDLDDFKQFNDTWGHLQGDLALQHFSQLLKEKAREEVKIHRYGGEEFALVFLGLPLEATTRWIESCLHELQERPFAVTEADQVTLTATAGVAEGLETDTAANLLERADKALYQGKRDGKNTLVISQEFTQQAT
ncbi:GGDEF domain-containing protein [Marinospirillum perlucidum]|uniref:GGDEF domain-containing protein n=1 Tax=Marinospirillum perlucidum TaxID=1982602 RepID=UPI000DF160FB|nr:GGDEF domain-containing protein [Marinospirillum perlucidum]